MMIKDRVQAFLLWVREEPFKAIELISAPPLFVYGVFLLFFDQGTAEKSAVYSATPNPSLTVLLSGLTYGLVGAMVFIAAYRGRYKERRIAVGLLFVALLYSILMRINEFGLALTSLIFIWVGVVTAFVDVIQLSGRRED